MFRIFLLGTLRFLAAWVNVSCVLMLLVSHHLYTFALLFGFALIAVGVLALPVYRPKERVATRAVTAACGISGLIFLTFAWFSNPDRGPGTSTFRSEGVSSSALDPARILTAPAEADLIRAGTLLAQLADPRIDSARAERILRLTLPLYRSLDETVGPVDSVFHLAMREILGLPFESTHFYEVRPHKGDPKAVSHAVIFLHGSVGNFKFYPALWQRYADSNNAVVALPTFGAGNWHQPGGLLPIRRAIRHLTDTYGLKPEQMTLVGLSNGGLGVLRAALDEEIAIHRFAFLSGVIEGRLLLDEQNIERLRNRQILLIHGDDDERIPVEYNRHVAAHLKSFGIGVTELYFPKEDHFLFASKPDEIFSSIERFAQE